MSAWNIIESSVTPDLSALVALARELGSRAEPTPIVPIALATVLGIDTRGVAVALFCGPTSFVPVRASRDGGGWRLSGSAGAVPWGEDATTLLIAAVTDEAAPSSVHSLGLFIVDTDRPGVVRSPRSSIGAPSMAHVRLDDVHVSGAARYGAASGAGGAPWSSVVPALDKATIVTAAELAGVARGALDAAVAYATRREQFGAPIATYQALAHRLADMAIDTDSAELAVEEALDAPTAQNASRAKIIANDAAHRVTAGLHQINGGVGFYADQTPPAFYARALALRFEMGDSAIHRTRLA